jgi:Cu-processing system ATP-binding protein
MTGPVLQVDDVSVRFGAVRALSRVSLTVAAGERVALLGHNGAGKSTLFKSILGFLRPEGGAISVAGGSPGSAVARRAVSYLPEAVAFPKTLTGREIVTHFARLKGEDPRAALPLLDRVGIAHAADRRVGTYSKGMRQRLGLAQALIGRPRLLLLDEPTSGLDPVSRRDFYGIVAEAAAEGTAVLLSSHSLSEVESKTDRIVILSAGRLVAEGTLADLTRRAGLPITVRVEAEAARVEHLHVHLGGVRENGTRVVLSCAGDEKLPLLARITAVPDLVSDVEIVLPGLDDVYDHYSRKGDGR